MFRRDFDALFSQIVREPFLRPLTLILIVDARKRLKRHLARLADVVEFAADAHCEDFARCALVKDDDACILVLAECRFDAVEVNGFARASRPDHERVADLAYVKVQPIGACSIRLRIEERRRVEMLVAFFPCPCERQGHHVDEVAGRYEGATDVMADKTRHAAKPCVNGIEIFDLGFHAALDKDLSHELRLLFHFGAVFIEDDDSSRIVDEGDVIALDSIDRVANFRNAVYGNIVDVFSICRTLSNRRVGNCRGQRLHLSLPVSAFGVEFGEDVVLCHAVDARHPAIGKIQTIEFVEQSEYGFLAVGNGRDDAHVLLAELRLKAAIKRRVEKILVHEQGFFRILQRPMILRHR